MVSQPSKTLLLEISRADLSNLPLALAARLLAPFLPFRTRFGIDIEYTFQFFFCCLVLGVKLSPFLQHNIFKAVMKYLLPTLRAITVVYNPMYCRFLLHHKLTVHNSKKLFRIFPPRMFVDMFTSKIYRKLKK